MTEHRIEVVDMPPMRVASFWAYGREPELAAMEKLTAWARPNGLLDDLEANQVYGYNHPMPSPATPNYGYEYWIRIDRDFQPEEGMRLRDFPGGKYAMLRIKGSPADIMEPGWSALVAWLEQSEYTMGQGDCLERHVRFVDLPQEEWVFEFYLPIAD